MRDFQRKRVYDAEDLAGITDKTLHRMMSQEETRLFVAKIIDTPYWLSNYGLTQIVITGGKKHVEAHCEEIAENIYKLRLPDWSRLPGIVLHELAHATAFEDQHGPIFCKNYIDLLHRFYSAYWAGQLAKHFDVNGVKVAYQK